MYKIALLLLISGIYQTPDGWDLLATTSIKKGVDPFLNEEMDVPDFSEALKEIDGKPFTLEGYIIPLQQDKAQDYFVLSRFPYQSCFFCGAAGPETVVEAYTNRAFDFTDGRVRVSGTLHLNATDPLRLFFVMEDCEVTPL